MKYLNDVIGLAGLALVGGGIWLYEPRISMIVVGSILLLVAYRSAVK